MFSNNHSTSLNAFWGNIDQDVVMIGHQDVRDFNVENILPQPEHKLNEIRTWLKPTNYEEDGSEYQKHLSSHLAGTGAWVYDTQAYTQWHDSDEHGILWFRGIPGSGKSVLASTLIHHFMLENVPILYFFFRHTIEANHGPEALLRDWLAQILNFSPPVQSKLMAYTESKYNKVPVEDLSMTELWRYLRMAMSDLGRVYCVVDALDEMDRDALEPFLHALDALGQWRPANVKLVITSRPIAVVEQVLRKFKLLDVRLLGQKVEDDVSRYVQHRIDTSSLSPVLRSDIQQAVLSNAHGLFLYAKLALDTVFQAETDTELRLRLNEMPADLTLIYANLLQDHSGRTGVPAKLQELVLQLVTHATRPLRLLEIAELVRVERGQDENLGKVKDLVRSTCGPLLEILPDETVRVVHHSLTEYLKGTTPVSHERPFPVFEAGDVNKRLAISCLRYLTTRCLDEVNIGRRRKIQGDVNYLEPAFLVPNQLLPHFAAYAGSAWPVHVRRAIIAGTDQTEINEVLDDFFIHTDMDKVDVLAGTKMDFQPTPLRFAIAFDLHEYASKLFSSNMRNGLVLGESILLYAVEKGNDYMVKLLLDHQADIDVRNNRGWTALHLAVNTGHTTIAALLLNAGIGPATQSGPDRFHGMPGEGEPPWTPSSRAFSSGSIDMALVFHGRLQTTEEVAQAFHQAVDGQNHEVIQMLFNDLRVDVNVKMDSSTALYKAAWNRDAPTMRLLLRKGGADPNVLHNIPTPQHESILYNPFEDLDDPSSATEEFNPVATKPAQEGLGETALHALVREPYHLPDDDTDHSKLPECFALLLGRGADVHQRDLQGNTPLHLASNPVAVSALLKGGADPNAINYEGQTLMHIAFSMDVLEALSPQAQIDPRLPVTSQTPLLSALRERHDTFEKEERRIGKAMWLLDHGADPTAVDVYGDSPLHLAVGLRHIDKYGLPLLRRLVSVRALVNLRNKDGKTPLHMNGPGSGRRDTHGYDSGKFRPIVYKLLMDADADLEVQDSQGRTPMFQIVEVTGCYQVQEQITFFLQMIQDGAKVRSVDFKGRTMLHAACNLGQFGHVSRELIDFLIHQGVDPAATDNDGNTIIHEVAPLLAKNRATLDHFLDLNVSPLQHNSLGRTALHVLSSFRPLAFDPSNSEYTPSGQPDQHKGATTFVDFLKLYEDVDVADRHGITPLHLASTFSEYLTSRLLDAGANVRIATREGLTSLHLAARSRRGNIIGILLDHLRSKLPPQALVDFLNAKDTLNRSALYYAVASGHEPSVRLLLKAGANANHDQYAGSPWSGCVDFEDESQNAEWSRQASTDMHRTQRKQRKRILGEPDAGGVLISDTLRPEAVIRGHRNHDPGFSFQRLDEVVNVLVSSASDGTASLVRQALESAIEKGHTRTSTIVLRACDALQITVDPDVVAKAQRATSERQKVLSGSDTVTTQTITDWMALREYTTVMESLSKVDLLERQSYSPDSTLLHQFVLGGFRDLVSQAVIDQAIGSTEWQEVQGRDRDSLTKARMHVQPLIVTACQREEPNMEMLRVLVEQEEVDVNACTVGGHYIGDSLPGGPSALHYLVDNGHWWQIALAIPYLIEHGANLEIKDNDGFTPLGVALRSIGGPHFSRTAVEMLLRLGANPNQDHRGTSYLSMTVKHKDIFELLVSSGAVISQPSMRAAIQAKDIDLLRAMLEGGADPNMRKVGHEVPQRQTGENSFEMARHDPMDANEKYLIDFISSDMERSGRMDESNVEMLKLLISYGANPFAHYEKTTVLHNVLQNKRDAWSHVSGLNPYLELLLDTPGLDYETCDSGGMTLLLLTSKGDYGVNGEQRLMLLQKLVELGADIHARDNQAKTALHYLSSHRHADRSKDASDDDMKFVVSKAPGLIHAEDAEGSTPLQMSLSGRFNAADSLISFGADVSHANKKGITAMHLVLKRAQWIVMTDDKVVGGVWHGLFQRIVSLGANINARDAVGETPLFAHFRTGSVTGEVPILAPTDSEADEIKTRGSSYLYSRKQAQLEQAAGIDKEHLVFELFDQHGADWSIVNNAGQSLLHIVAEDTRDEQRDQWTGRRVKRFVYLMGKGLDPRMEDHAHRTPLDLAAKLGLNDLLDLFKEDRQ